MTALRREEEYHRLANELFKFERITGRISKISSKGFPTTHIYSMMMQLPMKHALSKAYQEWQSEPQIASSKSATVGRVEADASTDMENRAGGGIVNSARELFHRGEFLIWLACIVGITFVDSLEHNAFASQSLLNALEYLFFLSSFLLVPAFIVINRKRYYRHVDTLINWSRDGKSRRALIVRLLFYAILYSGGQFWAYICLFRD